MTDIPVTTLRTGVIKKELEELFEETGQLTPADVVQRATDPESPLHTLFTWEDSEAATRYRLIQAAGIIRSVKIHIVHKTSAGETETVRVRAFMAARAAGDEKSPEGYVPEHQIREDPAKREIMLRQMQRELDNLHRRYRHLQEYWTKLDELSQSRAS